MAVIISLPIILIVLLFFFSDGDFMGPHYETNMYSNFIPSLKEEYGLKFHQEDEIKHYSSFTVADDAGWDLIIYNKNLDFKNYIRKDGVIEYLDPNEVKLWHTYDLCLNEPLEIKDIKIRKLICSLEKNGKILPMSSLDGSLLYTYSSGNDMPGSINIVIFFPDENLVWIKYFNW